MRKSFFLFFGIVLLTVCSCKRVCYNCNQYCAYCTYKNDSTLITKVCAKGTAGIGKVDKAMITMRDSGYTCTLLDDNASICDTKNSVANALEYHRNQDYFCDPK